MPCPEPMEKGRVQLVGTDTRGYYVEPRGPKTEMKWREARPGYLVGSVGQRSQGGRGSGCPGRCPHANRVHGAGRGSPRAHTGLLRTRAEASGWVGMAGGVADHLCPSPPVPWAGFPTFESISTQALELILASGHACGTMLAWLALTWGAVIALPDALAA